MPLDINKMADACGLCCCHLCKPKVDAFVRDVSRDVSRAVAEAVLDDMQGAWSPDLYTYRKGIEYFRAKYGITQELRS